ncbi:hypothetical protein [Longispora albida]|uniref:hypothetical protein n=1 Tax=Longispora albida TaxID=203523 RepID=UPI00036AE08E|nr:hypothetical protein [Longispora albida]
MTILITASGGGCGCQRALEHWARCDLLLAGIALALAAADEPRLRHAAEDVAAGAGVAGQIIGDVVSTCRAHRRGWRAAAQALAGTVLACMPALTGAPPPAAIVLFAAALVCSVPAVRALPWAVRAVWPARHLTPAARVPGPGTVPEAVAGAEEYRRLGVAALSAATCAAGMRAGLTAAHTYSLPRHLAAVTACLTHRTDREATA